jgi:hypothetical protein
MLAGGEDGCEALAAHLAQCPQCRRAAGILAGLGAAGQSARERALPAATIERTRRLAAESLRAPAPVPPRIAFPAFGGLAYAGAALALVLAAAAVVMTVRREAAPAKTPVRDMASAGVTDPWESGLRGQRMRVSGGLARFSETYLVASAGFAADGRAADLRRRIETCAAMARRDL